MDQGIFSGSYRRLAFPFVLEEWTFSALIIVVIHPTFISSFTFNLIVFPNFEQSSAIPQHLSIPRGLMVLCPVRNHADWRNDNVVPYRRLTLSIPPTLSSRRLVMHIVEMKWVQAENCWITSINYKQSENTLVYDCFCSLIPKPLSLLSLVVLSNFDLHVSSFHMLSHRS